MEEQLEAATRDFINDPIRNQIKQKEMAVSRIFQWFAGDFGSKKNVTLSSVSTLPSGE